MEKKPMDDAFKSGCSVGYHEGFLDGKNVGIDEGMAQMIAIFEQQVGQLILNVVSSDYDKIIFLFEEIHVAMNDKRFPGPFDDDE